MGKEHGFQARASEEGREAQQMAEKVICGCGFAIVSSNSAVSPGSVTVNLIGASERGRPWYFIVSGAFTSYRAGLGRTDTVFKVLGKASVLSENGFRPVVLLTTNLPRQGSVGDQALRGTHGRTFFDALEMFSTESKARLRTYARADAVTSPLPGFWALEELYGTELHGANLLGADRSAPLAKTGDPFGLLASDSSVRSMPHRLKVFVPSQTRSGSLIPEDKREKVIQETMRDLIALGGGATSSPAQGHWVCPGPDWLEVKGRSRWRLWG